MKIRLHIKKNYIKWQVFRSNLEKGHFIDAETEKVIASKAEKWKHILKCILDAILFCVKNSDALRGSTEVIGDPRCGKFLNTIELISHYDPVLKQHIEKQNKGSIKYFSSKVRNELLHLVGSQVKNTILEKIKKAKYYSIILDTTDADA